MKHFYTKKGAKWINDYFYVEDYILIKIYKDLDSIYEVKIDKEDFNKVKNYTWRVYNPRKNSELKDIYNICTSIKNINNTGKRGDVLIYQIVLGTKFQDKIVDHINMNRFDNRKSNLRIVNRSINAFNQEYKKYNIDNYTNKWLVKIRIGKKDYNFGRYSTEEEAKIMRYKLELALGNNYCSTHLEEIKRIHLQLTEEDYNNKYIKKALQIKEELERDIRL